MIGINDRSIAFAFDMRCGELLVEFESERQQRQMEAMAAGSIASTIAGASGPLIERSSPIVLNA